MLDFFATICYNVYSEIKEEIHMINIRTIRKLKENDGLTLKNGKAITYKTGYQVATEGVECYNPESAMLWIRIYGGNCGIWYSDGIYYIDNSHRVNTKKNALEIGKKHNQISILGWKKMDLIYC